jgi:hypothetical protein
MTRGTEDNSRPAGGLHFSCTWRACFSHETCQSLCRCSAHPICGVWLGCSYPKAFLFLMNGRSSVRPSLLWAMNPNVRSFGTSGALGHGPGRPGLRLKLEKRSPGFQELGRTVRGTCGAATLPSSFIAVGLACRENAGGQPKNSSGAGSRASQDNESKGLLQCVSR